MIYIDKEYINNGNQDATLKDYLNYKNIKCKNISPYNNYVDEFESTLINYINSLNKFEFIMFYRFNDENHNTCSRILDIQDISYYNQIFEKQNYKKELEDYEIEILKNFDLNPSFCILYKFNNQYYVLYLTRYSVYKMDYKISDDYKKSIGCYCKVFNEIKFNTLDEAIKLFVSEGLSYNIVEMIEYYDFRLNKYKNDKHRNKNPMSLVINKNIISVEYLLTFLNEDNKKFINDYFLNDLHIFINNYNTDIETILYYEYTY